MMCQTWQLKAVCLLWKPDGYRMETCRKRWWLSKPNTSEWHGSNVLRADGFCWAASYLCAVLLLRWLYLSFDHHLRLAVLRWRPPPPHRPRWRRYELPVIFLPFQTWLFANRSTCLAPNRLLPQFQVRLVSWHNWHFWISSISRCLPQFQVRSDSWHSWRIWISAAICWLPQFQMRSDSCHSWSICILTAIRWRGQFSHPSAHSLGSLYILTVVESHVLQVVALIGMSLLSVAKRIRKQTNKWDRGIKGKNRGREQGKARQGDGLCLSLRSDWKWKMIEWYIWSIYCFWRRIDDDGIRVRERIEWAGSMHWSTGLLDDVLYVWLFDIQYRHVYIF